MNPFRYGEVVTKSDFCARPALAKRLRGYLESGHNSVILGERRTGKTSLIVESVRRLRGLRLLYAQFWAVKSVDDVAARLLRGIATMRAQKSWIDKVGHALAHLRPRIEFDPASGQPSVTLGAGTPLTPSGLDAVFDLIEEVGQSHRLAVALDEFQDIRAIPEADEILGVMRARIQRHNEVPYLFAGSIRHEMERVFRDPSSPFFKSLRTIEVGPLDRQVFQAYLDKRFRSGKRTVSEPAFDMIFSLAEENPSDVQQLCAAIWETTEAGNRETAQQLHTALDHLFATERKGYEILVKPLTNNQLKVLRGLASVGGAQPQSKAFLAASGVRLPASVKRALDRLVKSEIVYGSESDYKFFDPFFRQWILRDL
jgi:hypothetical protein